MPGKLKSEPIHSARSGQLRVWFACLARRCLRKVSWNSSASLSSEESPAASRVSNKSLAWRLSSHSWRVFLPGSVFSCLDRWRGAKVHLESIGLQFSVIKFKLILQTLQRLTQDVYLPSLSHSLVTGIPRMPSDITNLSSADSDLFSNHRTAWVPSQG